MIPVCGHLIQDIKAFDTAAATRPVSGRVADDFNAYESLVQLLQAGIAGIMRCYKVLKNAKNSLSKNAIFVVSYGETFFTQQKWHLTSGNIPQLCAGYTKFQTFFAKAAKMAYFTFTFSREMSFIMEGVATAIKMTDKMHKWAAGFMQIYEISDFFCKSGENAAFYP